MVVRIFNMVEEFTEVVRKNWEQLHVVEEYLNEAGLQKKRALKEIYDMTCFADDFKTLAELVGDIKIHNDDHPEYLRTMRQMIRVIQHNAIGGNANV